MKVLRKIHRFFERVVRVFQGSFKRLKRSLKVVSRKFQGCFMIFKGVPRVFQRFLRKFQENFQGVSKKFHVAWHSSQLPEQKEGLFFL